MNDEERAAIERLIEVAKGDSGQSRRVANFLLAWWNAAECGGFDFTDAWGCDPQIQRDMAVVFAAIVCTAAYPDDRKLGYGTEFSQLAHAWRDVGAAA